MSSKAIFRTLNRIHIFLYRKSGGRILGKIVGSPVLLLTTIGRKTGQARTVPIVYLRDDQHYIVMATDDPAWYRNLKSTWQASVEIKGQKVAVTGRDAAIEEAPALWAKFVTQSPAFKSVQGKLNHQLVILEPIHP
jgi:F420H(2)-dependent quinone reductase